MIHHSFCICICVRNSLLQRSTSFQNRFKSSQYIFTGLYLQGSLVNKKVKIYARGVNAGYIQWPFRLFDGRAFKSSFLLVCNAQHSFLFIYSTLKQLSMHLHLQPHAHNNLLGSKISCLFITKLVRLKHLSQFLMLRRKQSNSYKYGIRILFRGLQSRIKCSTVSEFSLQRRQVGSIEFWLNAALLLCR